MFISILAKITSLLLFHFEVMEGSKSADRWEGEE